MRCERITLEGGAVAIVCTSGRDKGKRARCTCGAEAGLLCDAPAGGPDSGATCSAPVCSSCRVQKPRPSGRGAPLDYCPRCEAATRPAAPAAPAQAVYFVDPLKLCKPCPACGHMAKGEGGHLAGHLVLGGVRCVHGAPWKRDCLDRPVPPPCCPGAKLEARQAPPPEPVSEPPAPPPAPPPPLITTARRPLLRAVVRAGPAKCARPGCGCPLERHGPGGCTGSHPTTPGAQWSARLCTCIRFLPVEDSR